MCRRVATCWGAYQRGRLSDSTYTAFFAGYAVKTIVRMHCFCDIGTIGSGRTPQGIPVESLLQAWNIPLWFANHLAIWLGNLKATAFQRPTHTGKRTRKVIVCGYASPVYDHVSLQRALSSPDVKQCTPPGLLQYFKEHGVPATGFEYTKPLGLFFCNTPRLARSLTSDTVSQLTIGDPAEIRCECEHPVKGPWLRANGFIPPGRDHVVTCDSRVLKAPAGLQTLFQHGYKHRPEELSVTMTQQVRHDVVTRMRSGIEKFVNATVLVHRNMGNLPLMVQKVCAGIERQLSAHKFRDGQVFTNQSKPHEPGTVFTKWHRGFKQAIQKLQRLYAITTADKLGKNYVVVCIKLYVTLILQDLNIGGFYLRVIAGDDTRVIDKVAAELVQAVNLLAKNMYSNLDADRLFQHMCLLPYAAALVKLHKSPLQFRFLACSSKNGLKVVALWLNALLSSIHHDLVLEWHKLLSRLGVDWRHLPPWYATRSAQVVSLVKHFNKLRVCESEFVRGSGWQGFDVVRLYTNIPQDDLVQSLSALLGELVWDKHTSQRNGPRTRIYQVFKDQSVRAPLHNAFAAAVSHPKQARCLQLHGCPRLDTFCAQS
eukprot:GHUV01023092.1.p1 GENE.GHUV01023092.1~~GHUV01023092.1.p1  ORF type:complete len:597 (-),score=32.06 GHUV01023092.1:95-1885(-)